MAKRSNSMPEINGVHSTNNVVGKPQTIFIHKLYDMLQDSNINHLIWWSGSDDSFFILPTEEFSKVLAWYFKHTNIASFIRQLNMYGFHKVNDDNKDKDKDPKEPKDPKDPKDEGNEKEGKSYGSWEFKHSNNQFRKGDIESLKLIKRRSSKNINKEIVFDNLTPTSNPLHPMNPMSTLNPMNPMNRMTMNSPIPVSIHNPHLHMSAQTSQPPQPYPIQRPPSQPIQQHPQHQQHQQHQQQHNPQQHQHNPHQQPAQQPSHQPQQPTQQNPQPHPHPQQHPPPPAPPPQSQQQQQQQQQNSQPPPQQPQQLGFTSPGYFNAPGQHPSPHNDRLSITSIDDISMYHNNVLSHQYTLQNNISIDKYLELLNNFNNLKFDFSNLLNKFDYFLNDYKVQQKNLVKLIEILQSNDLNDLNGFKHYLLNNLSNSILNHDSFSQQQQYQGSQYEQFNQQIGSEQPIGNIPQQMGTMPQQMNPMAQNGIQYYPLNPHYSLRTSTHNNKSISVGPTTTNSTPNPNGSGANATTSTPSNPNEKEKSDPSREKPKDDDKKEKKPPKELSIPENNEVTVENDERPPNIQCHSAPATVPLFKIDNESPGPTSEPSQGVTVGLGLGSVPTPTHPLTQGHPLVQGQPLTQVQPNQGQIPTPAMNQPPTSHGPGFHNIIHRGSRSYSPFSKDKNYPFPDPPTPRTSIDSNITAPSTNSSSNTVPTMSSVAGIERKILPSVSELDRSIKFGKEKRKLSDSRLDELKKSRT